MVSLIHQAIDQVADSDPDQTAIRYLDGALSYQRLSERSNALAHTLIDAGVSRRDPVGIYMDKSLHTAVALYGIMKAGAAYVPLDPAAPLDRTNNIINDCAIKTVISADNKFKKLCKIAERSTLSATIGLEQQTLPGVMNSTWAAADTAPSHAPPAVKIIEHDLAYIMYTSGSTGVPKGMMHTHASGLSFARWARNEYQFDRNDVLSNHAPLHFDLSIMDYFSAGLAGSTTAIIPEEYTKLPASYSQLIEAQRITVLYTVPFALIQLSLRGSLEQRDLSALRWVIFGGEPMPVKHLRALMKRLPQAKFDNIYGPAEVNGVSHYTVGEVPADSDSIPIGPIADTAEALIVDEQLREIEGDEAGELLVRSPTMMQGYWGRDDLNEKAFYTRTIVPGLKETFYRTGDLARRDSAGLMWFLGRIDRQAKVRGYRVELDEVEAALTALDEVEEAGVFVVSNEHGASEIYAAIIPGRDVECDVDTLRKRLKLSLPWYSLPAGIETYQEFPRTSSGKIDRRRLREEFIHESQPTTH